MTKQVKLVILIFGAVFLGLIFFAVLESGGLDELTLSDECWMKKKSEAVVLKGIVKRIYIDSLNHGVWKISVQDGRNYTDIGLPGRDGEVFATLKIGDSITKNMNSLTYFISNQKGRDTVTIDYKCK